MKRREFIGMAAAAAVAPMVMPEVLRASVRPDASSVKIRRAPKPQVVYKSPHGKPNALQATPTGMWVQDQGPDNWVSFINYADGKVIREFQVDMNQASGITIDADGIMWHNSTHDSTIIKTNQQDGKVIAKYWCHGAGRIYSMKGDPAGSRSTLKPAYPSPARGGGAAAAGEGGAPAAGAGRAGGGGRGGGRGGGAGMAPGQIAFEPNSRDPRLGLGGTGGHGMENRDGLLYFAVPPARMVYVVDPKTWQVQDAWATAGNRPHGVAWDPGGDSLWVSDSNHRAFFRHDVKTGNIIEKIQLAEDDPIIHGVTFHDGYMWFCDDVGWVANFKL